MRVQCVFRVLECPHERQQPMFSSEYKRSNRTRMSKILRCFPHCCPTHRPRSYCGSALHVHVRLVGDDNDDRTNTNEGGGNSETKQAEQQRHDDDDQLPLFTLDVASPARALAEFAVYGRFETHDPDDPLKTELTLGQRVAAASITTARDPNVIWVAGEHATSEQALRLAEAPLPPLSSSSAGAGASRVFVLNQGDGESHHWEYDWRSGTSQRKRACQHQFRAYVFLPDAQDPQTTWQVVAMASSTPFTLSSYRKQEEDDLEAMAVAAAADLATFRGSPRGASAAVAVASESLPPLPTEVAVPRAAGPAAPLVPPPLLQAIPVIPGGTAAAAPASVNEILFVRQYIAAAGETTKLAVLLNLLAVVDVSWIDAEILTSQTVSILNTNPDLPPARPALDPNHLRGFAGHCVFPLLTALSSASPRPSVPLGSTAWFTKWRGTLELCIDVLCQLIKDGTLARLQTQLRRAAAGVRLSDERQVATAFVDFVTLLASETERIVRQLSDHASLDLLVDNIVSCVCDEDPEFDWVPRFTRDEAIRLLRNTSLLGLDTYREQLRQCAIADVPLVGGFQSELSRLFTGAWTCVSIDNSIARSLHAAGGATAAATDFGISALTALLLLVSSHAFEMVLDGDGVSLRLRTGWSFFSELWSAFILDGHLHASAVLPNGASPQVWTSLSAGAAVGDYRGALRRVEDGSVVLDLDVFVYGVNAPSYCVQLTMVPVVDRRHELQIHMRVYRSRLLGDAQTLRRDELVVLSPERRSELVAFSGEDLVVTAVAIYGQAH